MPPVYHESEAGGEQRVTFALYNRASMNRCRAAFAVYMCLASPLMPSSATAQQSADASNPSGVTIRAVRIVTPMQIDGRLDEKIYTTTSPTGGFLQQEPKEGAPATEPTDVWV